LKPFAYCLPFLTILFAGATLHAQNTLTTNPNVVFLNATVNGGSVQVPVSVSSAPTAVIPVTPSTNAPWLTFALSSGTTPATISFIASPSGLTAGVYNTVVSLASPFATTLQVVVVLTVNSPSPLISNPGNLIFNFSQGGALPGAQSLTITSSAVTPYTVSGTTRWLLFGGVNGQTPGTVTVGVDPTTLTAGSAYVGAVTLTPTNNQPALLVPVVFFVSSSPSLNFSGALTFNFQIGGSGNVTQKPLTVTSSSGTLGFSAVASVNPNPGNVQWLSVSPSTGATPATLMVSVAPATLPAGTYIGTITLNSPSASNPSQNVQVTLNVSTQPLLDLSPNSLNYTYQVGGAAPPDQTVTPNATAASLNYSIAVSTNNTGNWLSYVASGVTPAPVTVSVNPVGLPPGNYTGSLTFSAAGGGNNPQVVQVSLSISNNPALSASPGSLVFNFQTNQGQPLAQVVSVTSGGSPLGFTVSANIISTSNNVTWLLVGQPSAASTPATFTVAVSALGMPPGTYAGTVVLTAPGVSNPNPSPGCNGTLCIPVTLNVSNSALLSANPNSLSFAAQLGNSPNPTSVTVNSTGEAVTFTATTNVISPAGGTWLTVGGPIAPASSAAPSNFFVGITSQTLPAGVYKATITLHPNNGNPDVVIPVTVSISLGNLTVSPTTLSFTQAAGGNPPPSQTINVGSTGAILAFTAFASNANWITVSSGSGATPGQVTVSVNGANLQSGNYSATVNIVSAGAGNSPQSVTVNLTVGQGTNVSASPNTVSLMSQFGGSAPNPQSVALTLGAGSSSFTATAGVSSPANGTWLRVSPPSGTVNTTATNLIISADPTGLNPGTYNGSVTVTVSGAANSPVTIPVSYTVTPGPVTGGGGTKILPQVAFGGGWYTSLYFANTNANAVSFTVSFFGNDGRPLNVPSLGGSLITVSLAARGTTILEAPDMGRLSQGYAVATLPAGVTGNAVFRQSVDRAPQEAVAPLSGNTATVSTMVFDETNYVTGVAVVAIGPTDTAVIITVRDSQGNVIGNGSIPLAARNKTQFRLRDLPGMGAVVGRLGSVEFSVNIGNLAVLGLRFNGAAFTSIPTLDR